MRILLVNTYHFPGGGDSTYNFHLADLLREKGHQVAFFAMQDQRNLPDPNADLFVEYIDYRALNRSKSPLAGLQVLKRAIYSPEARRRFGLLVDRFQPDLVHVQNICAHITPSVILEAKKRGLPVVWTQHVYGLVCPNAHMLVDATGQVCEACGRRAYYQALLKRCKKGSLLASGMAALEAYAHHLLRVRKQVDAFVAPSAFLRDKLIELGFPQERLHHIPLFLPAAQFGESTHDEGYVLFLGKLEAIKGIRPLLRACRLAPEVRLILAGRADDHLVTELPALLPGNAQYVGMKHGEELRHLLHNALAVVLPSLWYENQPFSIQEAFACGKPAIVSDLGGMTELVRGRECGLLVPPGDVQALAGALRWLSAHPAEARAMGHRAYGYAVAEHGPEQHYTQLMLLYRQIGANGVP
jgi:glycosyltransferase involved in cell wall biosynthesis